MLDKVLYRSTRSLQQTGMLRCLLGVVASLIFAMATNSTTPYMAPLFAVMFLEKGKQPLGPLKSIAAILGMFLLGTVGLFLGNYIQDFEVVTLLILGLIIYWCFRLTQIPEALRMLFLILTLLLPYLSLTAAPLGNIVLNAMIINLTIALVFTQISYWIFPDPVNEVTVENNDTTTDAAYDISKIALNGLIVFAPMVLYFFYYRPNSMVITMMFIVILGMDPLIYKSKKTVAFIAANFLGGAFAIVAYNLLTVTPTFLFYIFLIIAAGIYFTYHMHDNKATAPIFAIGYRAFFVVMGTIAGSTNEAGDLVLIRLVGIGLAILYVILAYKILTFFNDPLVDQNEKV